MITKLNENKSSIRFKEVEPCYTGGGIYLYYGALTDGTFFTANSPEFDFTIVDSDPRLTANEDNGGMLDADYWEWIEEHAIRFVDYDSEESRQVFDAMYDWILKNEPQGEWCNYSLGDMEELKEVNLSPDRWY